FETEPELWAEGAVYNCTTHEWDRTNWQPIYNLSDHIKVDIAIQSDTQGMWMWYIDEDGDGSYEWVAKSEDWDWNNNLEMLPTMSELNNMGWVGLTGDPQSGLPEELEPCHNYTFHLSLHNTLNGNDNEYQGDTTSFTIEFYATQTDNPNCGGEEECYKTLSLPTESVTMVVHPGSSSYFDTTLSDVPHGYDVTNGTYVGWCCDEDHTITPGTVYSVHLYSSYDPNMPDYFKDPDWDMVNYILNHKQGTPDDVQAAIWYFIDHGNMPSSQAGKDMVNDALAHGEGFKPACGQIMAVICDAGENVQHTFIEVDP
ncbi:MAG: hypothetical protein J7L32_03345, partial [Thermoplasmata archaeon]|nr:hypothetical protein [Thermoplasmata archaeon]